MRHIADKMRGIKETYSLLQKLSSINGANAKEELLDRVMYNFETLPPLGKEYWWFLFFGRDGRQMMLLIFRKFGNHMTFNDEEVVLKKINQNSFQAVTAGWIYDGKRTYDLGVTNPTILLNSKEKTILSQISDRKMILTGGFPEYELKISGLTHLKMKEGDFFENKVAQGVFIPPFGVGWIDIYSNTNGELLGKEFIGTAHLQKVFGIMPYGPFHWARFIFRNGSMISFFCLKTGKNSKRYFHASINFFDQQTRRHIRFKKPRLMISQDKGESSTWTVEGRDEDSEFKMKFEAYAEKRFIMKGGGSQVYIEYAVVPKKFNFRIKNQTITLQDLGEGIGTFEDAYSSLF